MAVRFVCSCGQVLRVAESLPDYTVLCPVCGRPVGGAAPLQPKPTPQQPAPPAEKPRRPRRAAPPPKEARPAAGVSDDPAYGLPSEETFERQLSAEETQQVQRWLGQARQEMEEKPSRYREWPREENGYECVLYPLRAVPHLALLSVLWASFTPLLTYLLPRGWGVAELLPWGLTAALFLLLLSYTSAFLWNVLAASTQGDGVVPWPGLDLPRIARAGGVTLACFLAGPVVPAVVGFLFWLHAGDPTPVDVLILTELALLSLVSWAVLTLTVWISGNLADACPPGIVRLWRVHGWLPIGTALLAGLGLLGHCRLTLGALDVFQRAVVSGWLLLVLEWGGCMAGLLVLLRWLGMMMYWQDRDRKKQARRPEDEAGRRQRTAEEIAGDLLLDRDVNEEAIQDLASPPLRGSPESSDPDRRSTSAW